MTERLSRRKLIAQMSIPPLAASVTGALFGSDTARANSTNAADGTLGGARVFNVRDFGAKGDGESIDTRAVQSAIDAAHKDRGGTVLIPAGTFLIGTIE